MRIKTQLSILFIFAILTVTAFAVSMVSTGAAIDRAVAHSQQAYNLTHDVSILYRIASELTQNNHARIEKQWAIVMDRLHHDLDSQPHRVESFIQSMKEEQNKANYAFQTTIRTYKLGIRDSSTGDYSRARYYNRTHLALILNTLVAKANSMAQDSYKYIDDIKAKRTIILSSIGTIGLLLLAAWLLFFWRAIMTPLRKVYQAIKIVSSGDIEQRVPADSARGELDTLLVSFNAMLDRLQELTVSRKRLLDATETERARIGRELHDGITQVLVGARFKLEVLSKGCPDNKKPLAEVLDHLTQAQEEIQTIVKDLHPAMLEDLGLIETLKWFAEHNGLTKNITLAFGLTEQDIPHILHIPIFRIVQEATNNAQNHGNALNIHIQMNRQVDSINLFIEDDGKGFNPSKPHTGNGLINIRERVAAENGDLTIDSALGRGCCIIASFPIIEKEQHL